VLADGVGRTGSVGGGAVVVVTGGAVEELDGGGVVVGGAVRVLDVLDEPPAGAGLVALVVVPGVAVIVVLVVVVLLVVELVDAGLVVELVEGSGTGRSLARPPEPTRNATSSIAARPCRVKKSTQSVTAET
jgi:hypothetical protein